MKNEELAILIQRGQRNYILALWDGVRRFARQQSRRWAGRGGCEVEDLLQASFLALLDAVDDFRPEHGAFLTWYGLRLKAAFTEATGQRTQRQRQDPLQAALSLDVPVGEEDPDTTLADFIPDPAAVAAFEGVAERDRRHQLHEAMEQALAMLPVAQEAAIRGRYYRGQAVDQKEHSKALRALRNPVISRQLSTFL